MLFRALIVHYNFILVRVVVAVLLFVYSYTYHALLRGRCVERCGFFTVMHLVLEKIIGNR